MSSVAAAGRGARAQGERQRIIDRNRGRATVGADSKFQGSAPVGSGTSTTVVMATDPSGNVRSNTYQVTISGATKTFVYDTNGSLTGEGTRTYEWDGTNRLVRALDGGAEVVRFVYDRLGRRGQNVSGGVTRTYVYEAENALEERVSSGATIRYVHAPGIDQQLAKVEAGVASYYLADHLGNILLTTDASATVTLTRQYDPWGNLLQGSATAGYAYTGREWEPEIGLYYYRARYYDPKIGRFISEDPIGFDGGVNFYAYVENNPVTRTDPFGLRQRPRPRPLGDPACLARAGRKYRECANGADAQYERDLKWCDEEGWVVFWFWCESRAEKRWLTRLRQCREQYEKDKEACQGPPPPSPQC
jgi:RHS repeat-associated protein